MTDKDCDPTIEQSLEYWEEQAEIYKRAFELLYRKTDQIIPKEWFLETVKQVKKTWESGVI